jgi:hypothetical protein
MSEHISINDSIQPSDDQMIPEDADTRLLEEFMEEDENKTSIWLYIALAILGVVLIWIILGVWRYLQVRSYGTF